MISFQYFEGTYFFLVLFIEVVLKKWTLDDKSSHDKRKGNVNEHLKRAGSSHCLCPAPSSFVETFHYDTKKC